MDGYINKMEDFIQKEWHPLFEQYCIPARFIKCSKEFYEYLLADGVFIHSNYLRDSNQLVTDNALLFPQIQKEIKLALKQYGSCFVKVNWKSAKDCKSWLGGLQCQHTEDVFKTLKCSSYIAETIQDYQHLYPEHLYLILKKYQNLDRNLEFRCFIRNEVIFSCQRSTQNVFLDLSHKAQYFSRIQQFVMQTITPKFNKQRFVVDLYLTKDKIQILDIGPWREFTNPLMFEWEQLETLLKGELRVVEDSSQIIYEDLANYNKPNEQEMRWLMKEICGHKG